MASTSPDVAPGPPYASRYAQLGGRPTIIPDVPIAGVFLALYIGGAIGHMTIFQYNRRRGHKFIPSVAIFGYCMARVASMTLRIAWANFPTNVRLALAANIFLSAGVLILYVVNIILTQRIIRGTHPKIGWKTWFSWSFIFLYTLIPVALALIITASIQSVFTLDPRILQIDGYMRISAQTFLLFFSVLPLPLLGISYISPKPPAYHADKFGVGKWRTKVAILVTSTFLLAVGTAFRAGIGFEDLFHPRSLSNPGWYHSKAAFWIVSVAVELVVVYLYLLFRVDLRFWVPDGSSRVKGFSREGTLDCDAKTTVKVEERPLSTSRTVYLEGKGSSKQEDHPAEVTGDNVSEHSDMSDRADVESTMSSILSDLNGET